MPPEPPQNVPIGYLIFAIGGLCAAIGVLFWQLERARRECIDLAREVLPVVTVLTKLIERLERKDGGT